ncbi:MAG: O-antigen ligase family protein, partial [Coprococcus sp.]
MGLLLIYLFLCAASFFWSVDYIQTAVKVAEIVTDLCLIAAICRVDGSNRAFDKMMQTLLSACMLVQISILIGMIMFRGTFLSTSNGALGFKLTGGIVSANSVGGICVFTIICLLNAPQMPHKFFYMFISLLELFLCQARTSMVSIVLVLAVYGIKSKNKIAYFGAALCSLLVVYFNLDSFYAYFLRGTDAMNMQTMSGRTIMWDNAKVLIQEKPLLGYGFGAGGEMVSELNSGMTSLHSGIYECIIGVGYIGFTLLLLTYVCVLFSFFRMAKKHGIKSIVFEGMLLIDLTIRTYMSTGIGGWHSHTIMVWFLLVASLSYGHEITLSADRIR